MDDPLAFCLIRIYKQHIENIKNNSCKGKEEKASCIQYKHIQKQIVRRKRKGFDLFSSPYCDFFPYPKQKISEQYSAGVHDQIIDIADPFIEKLTRFDKKRKEKAEKGNHVPAIELFPQARNKKPERDKQYNIQQIPEKIDSGRKRMKIDCVWCFHLMMLQ